jgi:hypothetical protein
LVLYLLSTGFIFPAGWNGLGAHSVHYGPEQEVEAHKYFFLFQHFYVWANIPIKVTICLSILRLALTHRWMEWMLYATMVTILCASVATNIFLLTACKPLAATWDARLGTCRKRSDTVILGNTYSAINIAVDWTVALMPVFLLWRVNMPLKQKLTVMCVLSLGIFASTATLVRLHYLPNFTQEDDYLYGLGPIVLWTIIELGLALIAVSLMALRPLFRRFFGSSEVSSGTVEPSQRQPSRIDRFFEAHGWYSSKGLGTFRSDRSMVSMAEMEIGSSATDGRIAGTAKPFQ